MTRPSDRAVEAAGAIRALSTSRNYYRCPRCDKTGYRGNGFYGGVVTHSDCCDAPALPYDPIAVLVQRAMDEGRDR